jgi:hypothetical protein
MPNRGIECTQGEIVAFLDDDDVGIPLPRAQVAQFDAHPDAQLCSAGHVEADAAGRVTAGSAPTFAPTRSSICLPNYPCTRCRSSPAAARAFARISPFDETPSSDLGWYLRLVAAGGGVSTFRQRW